MTAVVLSVDAGPEDGVPVVAAVNIEKARRFETLLCPHPASVLLAHLVHPLRAYGPRRAVGTFLEPASVGGKPALDEVFEQTRAILTFAPEQPREVFRTQMAFNVIPGHRGEHVAAHVTALMESEMEVYIQLLRCGVFHSFGASVHLTLTKDPGEAAVRKALAAHPLNDASPDPDLLGMIDAAGRDEVLLGPVEAVAGLPGTYRIWAVMDNLTCGAAVNAVHILEAVSGAVMVN
jgi:aspartate-semialdehyde dehydrogenase